MRAAALSSILLALVARAAADDKEFCSTKCALRFVGEKDAKLVRFHAKL